LDVSKYVDRLIRAAAPERAGELGSVWGQDENRVHLTDRPAFDIGAWFGLIQLTEATGKIRHRCYWTHPGPKRDLTY
jgi:hypothetical protein